MSIWGSIRDKSMGTTRRLERTGDYITTDKMDVEEMVKNIQEMMKNGIVHFVYQKKDVYTKGGKFVRKGDIRDAWGTKKMDIIDKLPHGGDSEPKKVGYINYYDVNPPKGDPDWRCYWPDSVIGYYDDIFSYEEFERLAK